MNIPKLGLSFTYIAKVQAALPRVQLAFSQRNDVHIAPLGLAFSQRNEVGAIRLGLSFGQITPAQYKRNIRFNGSHAIGIGDFDIRVRIGGQIVPMCELAETMTIKHGENESYVCQFVLLKQRDRKQPAPIDPYAWYAKSIVIDVVHDGGTIRLYSGKVDNMGVNLLSGKFEVTCTDRREQRINSLFGSKIKSIGYTSVSAHGNFFETPAQELAKRLETVPASFDFDAHGTPYLNSWFEKAAADFTVTPCMIYQREPRITLASVGGVLNQVTYTVRLNYTRFLQRSLTYRYDSGLNVCLYARYRNLVGVQGIADAVAQTGWHLTTFDFEQLERSGWYPCGGTKPMGWMRDYVERTSANGKQTSKTRIKFDSVRNGTFSMIKRWTQPLSEVHTYVVRDGASIGRYELSAEELSYDIKDLDVNTDGWENGLSPHANGVKKVEATGNRFQSEWVDPTPRRAGLKFSLAPNGDWVAHTAISGDLDATLKVAYHTARCKIWASHRQNTAEFQLKFLPTASIFQTHQVEHSHFSGKVKVSALEHSFDFKKKRGQTNLTYRFFQNAEGENTSLLAGAKTEWAYPRYQNVFNLGRVELGKDEVLSERHEGMIYRLDFINAYRVPLYNPEVFRINTPAIEAQSTDAVEKKEQHRYSVNAPNTPIQMRI